MLQIALGGTVQKLITVFVAGIPAVMAGAVAYQMITGDSWIAGVTAIYGGLYHIPGALVHRSMQQALACRRELGRAPGCDQKLARRPDLPDVLRLRGPLLA